MGLSVVLDGPRDLRVRARPEVAAACGEVRVRPLAVGICGSDVHGYLGLNDRRPPGTTMGHELAALVTDATSPLDGRLVVVDPVRTCGACLACRAGADNRCARRELYGCSPDLPGGFAETMIVRAENLVPVDPGLDPAVAALTEPLAVGVHAVERVALAGADVLVVGGGPIGLGAALAAREAGAASVQVSEPDAHRRDVLAGLGLRALRPEDVTPGEVSVVLECVGITPTVAAALTAVADGGTVVVVGVAQPAWELDAAAVVMGERTLSGSAVYTRAEFARTADWVAAHAALLAPVVEHRVALDDVPGAFAAYGAGTLDAVKTLMIGEGA